jgi:ligand-binding sensor domain-containing protein
MKLFFLPILSTLCLSSNLDAQYGHLTFEQISIEQGLSQSIVFCVMQDHRGFMWFGTEDGLNKYDGYNFAVLRHDPHDLNSLSYSEIRAIHEDISGIFWIGTFYGGLNKYDPQREQFTHYRYVHDDPHSLSHDNVKAIYEDKSGVLWIGTEGGLNRFDRVTEQFIRYQHEAGNLNSLSDNVVNAICEDQTGTLWIATNGGLNRLIPSPNKNSPPAFIHYRHDPSDPRSLSHDAVTAIFADRNGVLWIGTQGGLNKLDLYHNHGASVSFTRYLHDPRNPHSLSHDDIRAIFEDSVGVFWIGTNGGGLNLFDREQGKFVHYQNDPRDPTSVSYNEIYDVYEDRSGLIWLGTYGGGANKVKARRQQFARYRAEPNNPNSLPHEIVWSIYEDEDGMLWIGTHGGGLTKLDRAKNQYKHFQHIPRDPNSLSNNIVRLICPSRTEPGVLWIGTHGGGLNKFDVKKEKFIRYRHDPNDPTSISHNELRSLYEDDTGVLWIGTNGGGLNKMVVTADGSPPVFKHYTNDPRDSTSLSNDFVRVIYADPDEAGKTLWIGTQGGGLNQFDRGTETFTRYRADPHNPNRLNNDYIFCIHEDEAGILWIGTWGGGINRFDRKTGSFATYTTREGLPSNEIYGILEDESGNFWISSNNGLSRFNPQTGMLKNYNVADGLLSNEFNGGSFFKGPSGEMFFGGIHGFNAFYPKNIKDNPHLPPLAITNFFKFNKAAHLERPISQMQELHLSYKDYVFSFEFAALDFAAPMKNQYAYKMEGLDQEWIYTEAQKRFATYTTLAPGRYVFRVKGSNNDGRWNDEGVSLKIVIHPPWWKTWRFRALAALLAIGLVYVWLRRRLKTVRMKIELQAAHNAQMSIMPHADPQIDGFDISGICLPANEVGGDFYDYLWLNEEKTKFGIAIGDVSGKAMQSAMTAVMSSGMIYAKAGEAIAIKDIVTQINRPMYFKTDRNMFTALCLAGLDLKTKALTFTNAGLIEPLLKSGEAVIPLEAAGTTQPLGIVCDNVYQERTVQLQSGDVLIFVTDGITEELNHAKEFYGDGRLRKLIHDMDTAALSAKEIKEKIITEVKRFSGATQQDDDMTVIVMKVA